MSDLLANVLGGLFIVAASIGIAYVRCWPEDDETLTVERYRHGSAPGVPLRRSSVRIISMRDGKPSVQAELDRIRAAEGAQDGAA